MRHVQWRDSITGRDWQAGIRDGDGEAYLLFQSGDGRWADFEELPLAARQAVARRLVEQVEEHEAFVAGLGACSPRRALPDEERDLRDRAERILIELLPDDHEDALAAVEDAAAAARRAAIVLGGGAP
ncbi:MAG TPA: hypothetical protein VIL45_07115 [Thermoplasmata archaeon]